MLGESVPANIPFPGGRRGARVEIPKAMIVERIRAQQGAEKANEADEADGELPDKVDTEEDAELLQKYGLDPAQLTDIAGGNPAVG
jgi:hypothetical protein